MAALAALFRKKRVVCHLVVEGHHDSSVGPGAAFPGRPGLTCLYSSGPGSGSGAVAIRECTSEETLGTDLVMNGIGVGSQGIFPATAMMLALGALLPN